MDWSATLLDAAGAAPQADYPLDGRSLLPLLRDPVQSLPWPMHWRMNHRGQRAYRAALEPERLERMRVAWQAWNDTTQAIPADATVSLGCSVRDVPQR